MAANCVCADATSSSSMGRRSAARTHSGSNPPEAMSRPLRVAVDVGGTFTDICVLDETEGTIEVAKVPSTLDPIEGVMRGIGQAGVDLSRVALFSHGTTVATNALITRRLPP